MATLVLVPAAVAAGELIGWIVASVAAGTAIKLSYDGLKAYNKRTRTESKTETKGAGSSGGGCKHVFSDNVDYVAKSLAVDRKACGKAIHAIKASLENNPDIQICARCGETFFKDEPLGNIRDHLTRK